MMWAISSGAGAGNAVPGWVSTPGSSTSIDRQIAPVQPRPQPAGGDRGDRRGIGEHELDPGVGQRRVDRQIRRPGLEHRQNRDDRLGRALQQQRHTLPRAHPLTGQQVRQPIRRLIELTIGPRTTHRSSAPPPSGRAPPARRTTPESTPASRAGSTPPDYRAHPAGHAHRHRAPPSTTTAAPDRRSSPPTPAATVPLNRRRQNSKMAARRPPC